MSAPAGPSHPRGGPLIMIALVLAGWASGRAVWWENPLVGIAAAVTAPDGLEPAAAAPDSLASAAPDRASPALYPQATAGQAVRTTGLAQRGGGMLALLGSGFGGGIDPRLAAAQHYLWHAALRTPLAYPPGMGAGASAAVFGADVDWQATRDPAPFLPPPAAEPAKAAGGRWSLDGWAFWRQGSDAAPIAQGRLPIYGASQVGAVLNYRLAPASRRDPRLYVRAYRALVQRGENEAALGASLRPVPQVPLRLAGEVRVTDTDFGSEMRLAAYAVTEIAPLDLPLGAQLEAYGQAGWVGGEAATPFADVQAGVTREFKAVADATDNRLRLSVGAAAWGGAQKDAQRIDLGPTMRLDLAVGDVPARIALDWRERVGGDAGPASGLAATLSTRF